MMFGCAKVGRQLNTPAMSVHNELVRQLKANLFSSVSSVVQIKPMPIGTNAK